MSQHKNNTTKLPHCHSQIQNSLVHQLPHTHKGHTTTMAFMKLPSSSLSHQTTLFYFTANLKGTKPISVPSYLVHYKPKRHHKIAVRACVKVEEKNSYTVQESSSGKEWGKVSAVLFDMDGVLCNSEEASRKAAVDVFAEMGVEVTVEDFVPFMGTGNDWIIWIQIVFIHWLYST